MKNMLFKSLIAMFLVITLCSLTACGGGGGSSNSSLPPTTAKVKVSIPANLFDDANLNPDVRADVTVQKLKVRATPYLNGTYVQDSEHPAVFGEASQKDNNFVADLSNISKTYDYRFSVLFGEGANEKELLNSYVSVASITEGASFKVDDISTKKVLAYEKWLENNPTDKKFNNFLTECSKEASKIGYTEDLYFDSLVNFPVSDLKESLVKITSGTDSNASLPTTASVDTEKLPATGNDPVNPDDPVTPDNPVTPTDPMVVGKIGDFNLKLVTTDTGYTYDGISHNSTYKSSTAWFKGTTDSNGIPATLMFYYKSDVAEKFTAYDIMQERDDQRQGGSGIIPTHILEVSDTYAVLKSKMPNK